MVNEMLAVPETGLYRKGRRPRVPGAMMLTITSTTAPASDVGFLLHKNPALYRVHECVFGVLALESEPVDPRL
jgi:hypothetical protein